MKYVIATVTALLLVLAGIALAGAGHGWVAGGFGCFALAPVGFFAVANGLSRKPSVRVAVSMLTLGLVLCLAVAIATASQSNEYLQAYVRATAPAGILVGISAYVGWLIITSLAAVRALRAVRHGT